MSCEFHRVNFVKNVPTVLYKLDTNGFFLFKWFYRIPETLMKFFLWLWNACPRIMNPILFFFWKTPSRSILMVIIGIFLIFLLFSLLPPLVNPLVHYEPQVARVQSGHLSLQKSTKYFFKTRYVITYKHTF